MSETTDKLKRISYAYQDCCGEQLYMYATRPTGVKDQYVFNNHTIADADKAIAYATVALRDARKKPDTAELLHFQDFPGGKRARVRQHANTVSAAIFDPVTDYVVESELFIDEGQARGWLTTKAKEYERG